MDKREDIQDAISAICAEIVSATDGSASSGTTSEIRNLAEAAAQLSRAIATGRDKDTVTLGKLGESVVLDLR